jgi:hypothetical protein
MLYMLPLCLEDCVPPFIIIQLLYYGRNTIPYTAYMIKGSENLRDPCVIDPLRTSLKCLVYFKTGWRLGQYNSNCSIYEIFITNAIP